MATIHGEGELAPIPDDLTIVQFMQDHQHPTRPAPLNYRPWFIDDESGRAIVYDEVCALCAILESFTTQLLVTADQGPHERIGECLPIQVEDR